MVYPSGNQGLVNIYYYCTLSVVGGDWAIPEVVVEEQARVSLVPKIFNFLAESYGLICSCYLAPSVDRLIIFYGLIKI